MFHLHNDVKHYFANSGGEIVKQIPAITIKEGELSVNTSVPHFIRNPKTGSIIAIIDTSGQFSNLKNTNAKILLTSDKIYVRKNTNETRIYNIGKKAEIHITQTNLQSWVGQIKKWLAILLYPFAVLGSFIYRMFQVIIYAATLVFVFNYFSTTKLDYQTILCL